MYLTVKDRYGVVIAVEDRKCNKKGHWDSTKPCPATNSLMLHSD